jgi:hypothetical protein
MFSLTDKRKTKLFGFYKLLELLRKIYNEINEYVPPGTFGKLR